MGGYIFCKVEKRISVDGGSGLGDQIGFQVAMNSFDPVFLFSFKNAE